MLGAAAPSQLSREPRLERSSLTDARAAVEAEWQRGLSARLSFMLAFCDTKPLEKGKKILNLQVCFSTFYRREEDGAGKKKSTKLKAKRKCQKSSLGTLEKELS